MSWAHLQWIRAVCRVDRASEGEYTDGHEA